MARIKTGVPAVKELLEGESEKRYIPSIGLVNYTRYNNKLFTNKMYDYPSPPLIDKKSLMSITRIASSETTSPSSDAILKDGTVQLTNDWDAGPNNITTASLVTSGDISVGDDLLLTSSASVINWNSGDVTLTHASGKLTFGGDGTVELDFNNHEMTNVDINSGAIDGTAIGAASHSTIKGTTIDATTDFTIGGLVITDGAIDDTGTLVIDGATGVNIQEGGTNVINIDTNRYIYFHAYADDINYQNYALNNKADKYQFTTGQADYNQNYSMISSHNEVTTSYTYPTGT
jgi:hypothetical protein